MSEESPYVLTWSSRHKDPPIDAMRATFYKITQHTWLSRKINIFKCLIFARGLPLGEWLMKSNLPSNCRLCNQNAIENALHALVTCQTMAKTWDLYNDF